VAGRNPATSPAVLAGEAAGEGLGSTRVRYGCLLAVEVTGHHGRWSRAAGAAGSSAAASWQPSLGNKWPGQLRWILTKVPRDLGSWETERAQEFTARPQW
jgi:hypothetical protein